MHKRDLPLCKIWQRLPQLYLGNDFECSESLVANHVFGQALGQLGHLEGQIQSVATKKTSDMNVLHTIEAHANTCINN